MADLIDVSFALRDFITAQIYPDGLTGQRGPSVPVKIYPGWPTPEELDADLATAPGKGAAARHVTIFPTTSERNTTRYEDGFTEVDRPAKTYTLTAIGQTVVVAGAAPEPYHAQNICVFVEGRAYIHQALKGQTPAEIATALAALIPGASTIAAAIIIPSGQRIGALRVGIFGTVMREVRRQERVFQISVWAESSEARVEVVRMFDAPLTAVGWLTLADKSRARLIYRSSHDLDRAQRQGNYVRHLLYTAEFPTTISEKAPEIVATKTDYVTQPGDEIAHVEE